MQFADHLGLIIGCRQFTSEGVWWVPLCPFESNRAVCRWRGPGHQTAPSRNTTRAFSVPAAEMGAGATDPVQIWCLQAVGTVGIQTQTIAALLVGRD